MPETSVFDLAVEDIDRPVWETLDDSLFTPDGPANLDSCGVGCSACDCGCVPHCVS